MMARPDKRGRAHVAAVLVAAQAHVRRRAPAPGRAAAGGAGACAHANRAAPTPLCATVSSDPVSKLLNKALA